MHFDDFISCGGPPVILPYVPSMEGDVVVEQWRTKIKFFHSSSAFDAKEKVEKEVNDFLARGDRVLVNVKFNCVLENLGEKVIVLLTYKEKETNEDEKKDN